MLLYDPQECNLEITSAGNVKLPSSAWGKGSYEFGAVQVCFYVIVLRHIQRRCPMALVDLQYLCWKGRMPGTEIPHEEIAAMLGLVPLIALQHSTELVLNAADTSLARFLYDAIIVNGFTAYLNPVFVEAAAHIYWRRENFPALSKLLQLTHLTME